MDYYDDYGSSNVGNFFSAVKSFAKQTTDFDPEKAKVALGGPLSAFFIDKFQDTIGKKLSASLSNFFAKREKIQEQIETQRQRKIYSNSSYDDPLYVNRIRLSKSVNYNRLKPKGQKYPLGNFLGQNFIEMQDKFSKIIDLLQSQNNLLLNTKRSENEVTLGTFTRGSYIRRNILTGQLVRSSIIGKPIPGFKFSRHANASGYIPSSHAQVDLLSYILKEIYWLGKAMGTAITGKRPNIISYLQEGMKTALTTFFMSSKIIKGLTYTIAGINSGINKLIGLTSLPDKLINYFVRLKYAKEIPKSKNLQQYSLNVQMYTYNRLVMLYNLIYKSQQSNGKESDKEKITLSSSALAKVGAVGGLSTYLAGLTKMLSFGTHAGSTAFSLLGTMIYKMPLLMQGPIPYILLGVYGAKPLKTVLKWLFTTKEVNKNTSLLKTLKESMLSPFKKVKNLLFGEKITIKRNIKDLNDTQKLLLLNVRQTMYLHSIDMSLRMMTNRELLNDQYLKESLLVLQGMNYGPFGKTIIKKTGLARVITGTISFMGSILNRLFGVSKRVSALKDWWELSGSKHVRHFAKGGYVHGKNEDGPPKDNVKAKLSEGEYVINKSGVKKAGIFFLNLLNGLYEGSIKGVRTADVELEKIYKKKMGVKGPKTLLGKGIKFGANMMTLNFLEALIPGFGILTLASVGAQGILWAIRKSLKAFGYRNPAADKVYKGLKAFNKLSFRIADMPFNLAMFSIKNRKKLKDKYSNLLSDLAGDLWDATFGTIKNIFTNTVNNALDYVEENVEGIYDKYINTKGNIKGKYKQGQKRFKIFRYKLGRELKWKKRRAQFWFKKKVKEPLEQKKQEVSEWYQDKKKELKRRWFVTKWRTKRKARDFLQNNALAQYARGEIGTGQLMWRGIKGTGSLLWDVAKYTGKGVRFIAKNFGSAIMGAGKLYLKYGTLPTILFMLGRYVSNKFLTSPYAKNIFAGTVALSGTIFRYTYNPMASLIAFLSGTIISSLYEIAYKLAKLFGKKLDAPPEDLGKKATQTYAQAYGEIRRHTDLTKSEASYMAGLSAISESQKYHVRNIQQRIKTETNPQKRAALMKQLEALQQTPDWTKEGINLIKYMKKNKLTLKTAPILGDAYSMFDVTDKNGKKITQRILQSLSGDNLSIMKKSFINLIKQGRTYAKTSLELFNKGKITDKDLFNLQSPNPTPKNTGGWLNFLSRFLLTMGYTPKDALNLYFISAAEELTTKPSVWDKAKASIIQIGKDIWHFKLGNIFGDLVDTMAFGQKLDPKSSALATLNMFYRSAYTSGAELYSKEDIMAKYFKGTERIKKESGLQVLTESVKNTVSAAPKTLKSTFYKTKRALMPTFNKYLGDLYEKLSQSKIYKQVYPQMQQAIEYVRNQYVQGNIDIRQARELINEIINDYKNGKLKDMNKYMAYINDKVLKLSSNAKKYIPKNYQKFADNAKEYTYSILGELGQDVSYTISPYVESMKNASERALKNNVVYKSYQSAKQKVTQIYESGNRNINKVLIGVDKFGNKIYGYGKSVYNKGYNIAKSGYGLFKKVSRGTYDSVRSVLDYGVNGIKWVSKTGFDIMNRFRRAMYSDRDMWDILSDVINRVKQTLRNHNVGYNVQIVWDRIKSLANTMYARGKQYVNTHADEFINDTINLIRAVDEIMTMPPIKNTNKLKEEHDKNIENKTMIEQNFRENVNKALKTGQDIMANTGKQLKQLGDQITTVMNNNTSTIVNNSNNQNNIKEDVRREHNDMKLYGYI